jgi:glycosyltransferase involved in cell wall biosynthesis
VSVPFLTIAIATHNRPSLLAEALASVAGQDCRDFEVVVVDDGSEPPVDLQSIVESKGLSARLVRHDRAMGGCAAKNAAVRAAQGRYVAFLDDDDLIASSFVRRQVEVLSSEPDLDVVFVAVSAFGRDADEIERGADAGLEEILATVRGDSIGSLTRLDRRALPALMRSVPIAFQRPTFRRTMFFDDLGGFRPVRTMWECEWAIRALCLKSVAVLNEKLHQWRVDGQGYFTDEAKALEVVDAGIVIRQRLYDDKDRLLQAHQEIAALRGALAEAWLARAYLLCRGHGRSSEAWQAWWRSMAAKFSWRRFRFLWRLLARTFGHQYAQRSALGAS